VAADEERCGPVCISLFDVSEGEGGALETQRDSIASRDTGVEMG